MCGYYVYQILLPCHFSVVSIKCFVLVGIFFFGCLVFFFLGWEDWCCLPSVCIYANCNNVVNLSAHSCQNFAFRKAQLKSKSLTVCIHSKLPCSKKMNQLSRYHSHQNMSFTVQSEYFSFLQFALCIQSNLISNYIHGFVLYVYSANDQR